MLKIVADRGIPFVERFFSGIGELQLIDGRALTAAGLRDADVLVCRTTTRVDAKLLENSTLRVVASPTSGLDHIDQLCLEESAIALCHAPGSNARAVAEYVLSALFVLAEQQSFDLSQKTVGIVGAGKVGSQLHNFLTSLGMSCRLYDPPLAEAGGRAKYCELADIQGCDIISLHVPLTDTGAWPTRSMLDEAFFQALATDVILVNTSRGEVIDESALQSFLGLNPQASLLIDVWSGEPLINLALLKRAAVATPHIAGYSLDAKLRATQRVFSAVCQQLAIESADAALENVLADKDQREISLSPSADVIEAVALAVLASYDVRSDAAALRRILEDKVSDRGSYFDDLRNNYPIRREFSSLGITLTSADETLQATLSALGFRVNSINHV